MVMKCDAIEAMLDSYRSGELTTREEDTVTRHIEACESCGSELESLRRLSRAARGLGVRAPSAVMTAVIEGTSDRYGQVETSLGPVTVGFSTRGVSMVYVGGSQPAPFEELYRHRRHRPVLRGDLPAEFGRAVEAAAEGKSPLLPPLDLEGLPPFERSVLELLRRIPLGEVRPYSWIAREAGRPAAVRAVGNSMARNPVPLLLPCHRVVPVQGGVGNYAFGSEVKRELLKREGAPVPDLDEMVRNGFRVVGCTSTGIYCHPACRHIQRALPGRRERFADGGRAEAAGYRPCRHCRP
jgi:O-6-methylguanine DNA methyltransferase